MSSESVSYTHLDVYKRQVVNIPSYSLRAGDVVSVREKSKSLEVITASLAGSSKSRYAWLEWDNASMSGKFLQMCIRDRKKINASVEHDDSVIIKGMIERVKHLVKVEEVAAKAAKAE